jgi:hypothetical protein
MRPVRKILRQFFNNRLNLLVLAYVALLVFGVWHAFPNLLAVADESPYVGGVLRALQAKTLIPHIDYSYTISFYANYFLFIPFLSLLVILEGGVGQAIAFLNNHVWIAYFIPRLVSVCAMALTFWFFVRMAEREGRTLKEIVVISVITFGNILFMSIAHTGKMWALSLFLWFLSFYFFSQAMRVVRSKDYEHTTLYRDPFFLSPLFACLACANFPVNIISLISTAWLFRIVVKERIKRVQFFIGSLTGVALFLLFLSINLGGWVAQDSITQVVTRSLTDVSVYFMYGSIMIIPLSILYAMFCVRGRGVPLVDEVSVLLVSLVAYIAIIYIRAPWVGEYHADYWRYFFYIVFFLGVLFVYFPQKSKMVAYTLATVSLVCMLRVEYLLAIPTTYNHAEEYLTTHVGKELVVNGVERIDLHKNRESSLITKDGRCGSRCQLSREGMNEDGLFVIDEATSPDSYALTLEQNPSHVTLSTQEIMGTHAAVYVAENGLSGDAYQTIDHNLGLYSWDIFIQDRLGEDVYFGRVER